MLELKLVSSMEKGFLDQTPADFKAITRLRMYRNERASFQIMTYDAEEADIASRFCRIKAVGELASYITFRTIEGVVNYLPAFGTPKRVMEQDPTYLRTEPGVYPDILNPLMRTDCVPIINCQLHSVWVDVEGNLNPGTYQTDIVFYKVEGDSPTEEEESRVTLPITVFDACLPEQTIRYTNWFYTDCLANYYQVEPFSERHFEICENYIHTAVKNGINMILTPVFTPPLDTKRGGERLTTQLVGIERNNGVYSFDFTLLDRWIDMLNRQKVKYIEISHLFSQWGAEHAPKVMVTVDGNYVRLFGWDTDAAGDEYVTFINTFIRALTAHLEARGDKDRTYFHISDEPQEAQLPQYKVNKQNIAESLKDWKLLDALSEVEFYKQGLCEIPVPSTGVIENFMPEDIKERWTYYCCGPWVKASNRYLSMHLARTRSIGMQLYKYGIEGLLHWGYNFYNNALSIDAVNPFIIPCAGYWVGSGDAHVVYPGQDGKPLESLRLRAVKQGLDDIRVMQLADSLCGKEKVVEAIENVMGKLDFMNCANDSQTMQAVRDAVDDLIIAQQERMD